MKESRYISSSNDVKYQIIYIVLQVAQRPVSTASSMKELHTEDPDTRNLHEFFPNSDSFA